MQDDYTALMLPYDHQENVSVVQRLLKPGPNLQSFRTGRTLLHFACHSSPDLAILLSLIETSTNPEISIDISTKPLMLTYRHGFTL